MGIFMQNEFWYAVAGMVSALLAIMMMDVTLAAEGRTASEKLKSVCIWIAALVCYFIFAYAGCLMTSPLWYDYFIFFGWLIFIPGPAMLLYKRHSPSTKIFVVVTMVFISNVASFLTGITTTALISKIAPFGPEGYLFLIPFTLVKMGISLLVFLLYVRFLKKTVFEVLEILEGKMTRYVPIPFITSIGFFFIVQIVQMFGLMPDKGYLFVAFYLIICVSFGVMYWLIFSNALWSSRAMRTQAELDVASSIQKDMLPCIFPPFPDCAAFDIYATMEPAKEVGGDFYDFFLVDGGHLAVVIADVSGKGVPAALFMVIAKTLIKNHAQLGAPPSKVFETVNHQLCETNDANMFVTAFMGILELATGKFTFVNAGHNPPLISREGKPYEWLRSDPGFVLAGLDDMTFEQQEIYLSPGDSLFLYTDGVTEALNPESQLYSDPRLEKFFNSGVLDGKAVSEIPALVRKDIADFARGAEQADDITMLILQMNGRDEKRG